MANKNRHIIKRDAGILANPQNAQLMRDFVSTTSPFYSTNSLMDEIVEKMVADKGKGKRLSKEFFDDYRKGVVALGLLTHVPVAETVKEEYRTFLVEMVRGIECEYDCKTPSEKALAETIASAYVRTLDTSRELRARRSQIDNSFALGQKTEYCKMLSTELDRANRHFTNPLLTLKQLKSPLLEVNVKAKNAFIAQNQQFNSSIDQNKENENNDRQ